MGLHQWKKKTLIKKNRPKTKKKYQTRQEKTHTLEEWKIFVDK